MRRTIALLALAASLNAAGASASTNTTSVRDAARAIAGATRKLRQPQSESKTLAAEMQRLAKQITAETRQKTNARLAAEPTRDKTASRGAQGKPNQTPRQRIYLFVSRSLKPAVLKEIFQTIAGTSVTAVFRGIPQSTRIGQASGQLYSLIRNADITPIPNISLNPTRWRKFNVQTVPTMILAEGDREIARVEGLTNPRWLRDRARSGQTGDLGVRGPITEPSEPDLITVMQERASKLDFAKLRNKATHSYWQDAPFIELPPASRDQRRTVDLRMRVAHDITAPDGTVIAHKGQIVDPLDQRAFTLRLVVFDATRPEQVTFANQQAKSHPDSLLMASRFDNDAGWKGYRQLSKRLNSKVYRLTRDVRSRFDVRATPSVIHANDSGAVVVDEHHIEPAQDEKKNAD